MSHIPRRAQRRDSNEKAIVSELRRMGISVMFGSECDIVCGWRGQNFMFEIKDPAKLFKADGVTFRKGAIKESQSKLRKTWQGQYDIVWSTEMILQRIGI